MRCPECQSSETKVLESRLIQDRATVRRRRECLKCDFRFTTYEREDRFQIRVEKADGRFEDFRREKLLKAVSIACQKRPVKPEQIEALVHDIERELYSKGKKSIKSKTLGDMLIAHMKELDHVAYVRFASVYKDFKTPDEFIAELRALRE